jgi:hypothetical protein
MSTILKFQTTIEPAITLIVSVLYNDNVFSVKTERHLEFKEAGIHKIKKDSDGQFHTLREVFDDIFKYLNSSSVLLSTRPFSVPTKDGFLYLEHENNYYSLSDTFSLYSPDYSITPSISLEDALKQMAEKLHGKYKENHWEVITVRLDQLYKRLVNELRKGPDKDVATRLLHCCQIIYFKHYYENADFIKKFALHPVDDNNTYNALDESV